ncbi:hypothetical protein [Erythrobacter sp. MTPC3]|uniref:hypothetical protein n=1 Tax=Erythrobacter sp. MTPC3 TaxID=3056564 RepID=UPI0036F2C2C1
MEDESRMAVHVDPDTPNVWRIEPYYSDLMSWAREAFKHDQQLVVSIARRMFAFLPDGEVDLGYVAEDEIVFTGMRKDGTYLATKLKANDPRVQGIEYGKPVSAKLEL